MNFNKWTNTFFILCFLLTIQSLTISAANCKGCTPLDELNFDKIVKRFDATLVKFDTAYAYGDKHEEFGKVALDLAEIENVLTAEVGIKDYGEKDNSALGEKYGVKKEDFPVLFVFHKNKQTGELEHHRFTDDDDFKANTIKTFIRQKTGIYLPLPGCIEEFDTLATGLLTAENPGEKGKVMAEAEKAFLAIATESTKKAKADIYIKIMRKVVKEGNEFAEKEMKRVKKVLKEGKIADAKKEGMEKRINVLRSFIPHDTVKDEL
jgi:endoplasmic reticulum protein 29